MRPSKMCRSLPWVSCVFGGFELLQIIFAESDTEGFGGTSIGAWGPRRSGRKGSHAPQADRIFGSGSQGVVGSIVEESKSRQLGPSDAL